MARKTFKKRASPQKSQSPRAAGAKRNASKRPAAQPTNTRGDIGRGKAAEPTPKIKHKPPRSDTGAETIYGKHSVRSVLLKRPADVEKILLAGKEEYHRDLVELAGRHDIAAFLLPWPEFKQEGGFGDDDNHQGALAFVKPRTIYREGDFDRLADARCILVLDQVSNPQNLATIIRSAAFFHADALLYMKNRAATPTAEVVRFAVGGAEMIDMYQITNIAQTLEALKDLGFTVLGMDERGKLTLAQHDLSEKTAFVIGAEGEGLRNKTRQYCTDLVRIPGGMAGVESLNAAVATTIALYEFARLMQDRE
jgi:23S rRNA (guanosine2251-2'-O)-methyltransferase